MKKYVITGMVLSLSLVSTLTGCSQQTQAETNPTTTATMAIETTVAETTTMVETYEDNTYTGKLENGDTYTTLNVPKLSTNRNFTEDEGLIFEIIIDIWRSKTDEEKVELQREGLIEIIETELPNLLSEEYESMADHILSQYPIPQLQTQQTEANTESLSETTSQPQTQETKAETNNSNTSNTNNNQPVTQSTQPAPVPQPTEPVVEAPASNSWEDNLSEADKARIAELEDSAKDQHVIDNSDLGEGNFGYDSSGEINLNGGM